MKISITKKNIFKVKNIQINKKLMEYIREIFVNMLINNTTNIVKFIGYGFSEENNYIEFRIILVLMQETLGD